MRILEVVGVVVVVKALRLPKGVSESGGSMHACTPQSSYTKKKDPDDFGGASQTWEDYCPRTTKKRIN